MPKNNEPGIDELVDTLEEDDRRREAERPLKSKVVQPSVSPSGYFMPSPLGPSQAPDFYFPSSQQPLYTAPARPVMPPNFTPQKTPIKDFIKENWISFFKEKKVYVIESVVGVLLATGIIYLFNPSHRPNNNQQAKTEQVYVPPKPQRVIPTQPQRLKVYTGLFGFDLYVSNENGSGERHVLDTKNGIERLIDLHPLANPDPNSLYLTMWKPKLSPDQQHIAFAGYDSKKDIYGLYVLDTSGSNMFLLWKRQKGEIINATNIKKFDWVNNNSVDIFTGAQFGGIDKKTTLRFNHTR